MKYTTLTSTSNPLIKGTLKLKSSPDRSTGFLIEGPHLVEAALAAGVAFKRVFFTAEFISKKEGKRLLHLLERNASLLVELSGAVFSRLSDTETPQGIIAVVSWPEIGLEGLQFKAAPFLAVCDGIQDPGNLGTIIRSADAAGADAVVVMPGTCNAFSPKAVRATAGSIFTIPVVQATPDELRDFLSERDIHLWGTDSRAERSIYEADLSRPSAIALGNEAHGVSEPVRRIVAGSMSIPLVGKAESLNVAMAATAAFYETLRQRRFSGR